MGHGAARRATTAARRLGTGALSMEVDVAWSREETLG